MGDYRSCSVSLTDAHKAMLRSIAPSLAPLSATGKTPNDSAAIRMLICMTPFLLRAVESVSIADDVAAALSPEELFRAKWTIYKDKYKD